MTSMAVVYIVRLHVDVMLMRDVESVITALTCSRVSTLRLCVRRLSLFACTPSYVTRLIPLLRRSVSSDFFSLSLQQRV